MYKPSTLFIAMRYLRSEKGDTGISFLSAASFIGIVMGTATLIIVLSLVNGFEREFKDRILSLVSHVKIYPMPGEARPFSSLKNTILEHPAVEGMAPFVYAQGMISNAGKTKAIYIKGLDFIQDKNTNNLSQYLVAGELPSSQQGGVVITKRLAEELQLELGAKINLVLLNKKQSANFLPKPSFKLERVIGLIDTHTDTDRYQVYGGLDHIIELAQKEKPDGVELFLNNVHEANAVSSDLYESLPGDFYFLPWTASHSTLLDIIRMVKSIFSVLLLFIILVAALNIVSNLVMLVRQKGKEIAVLKTLGLTDRHTILLFSYIGGLLSSAGVLGGILLGILISPNLNDIVLFFENASGFKLFKGEEYFINFLPSEIQVTDVAFISIATIAISVAACYYPAKQATKIEPVEAFRISE